MDCIRLSSKGQLVIPASIRKSMNLKTGTYLQIKRLDNEIILTPLKKGVLDRLYGRFDEKNVLEEMEKEHAEEIAGENSA